jgi:serine/threonine-protein kinase
MTPERWKRAKELFNSALELEANERRVFLDRECAGDNELRKEVESLLEADDETDSFMESPAVEDAADSLAGDEQKLEAGQKIGRYEIVSLAGEGGMGEVYLAHDTRLERKVALKLLPSYLSNDKGRLRRFEQEARSASALSHPNVCMIHEVGEMADESRPFIAMEFVDGITLRQRLQQGEIKLGESLDIAIQVASALTAAHEAGITHRDIKPENIMIRRDGYVKVLDFGLAKLAEQQRQTSRIITNVLSKSGVKTEPGVVLGTAQYMSPEQARGQAVDARTDIWALGAVLYEMAAGRAPFEGETTSDIIAGVLEREPVPLARYAPKLPENVEWIISKALRKDKEERYQTSKEMLTDLRSVKQRLEFEIELERSTPPNKASGAIAAALSGEQAAHRSAAPNVTPTDEVSKGRRTSSAEYVIREVKQHKLGAGLGLTVLLAAIVGLSYFFYFVPSTKAAISSVAVLPFQNGSGDASLDYLSDGLSESLIDKFSQLPQLKVIARSSSFKYRDPNIDVQDVANKLGVQAIVMGRVVRTGDNLNVRVEMIDASENRQLWSEQYNRKASDLLSIQQEITHTASEKLRLKLSGAQEQQLEKRETVNPQAYELVLKGNFFFNKGGEEGWSKAVGYYQQAIAVDPNYALAYAQLSSSYYLLSNNSVADPKEILKKAEEAARKALELDENIPTALASLNLDAWNWTAAEAEYKRVLELNPNSGEAHSQYSHYLSLMERHDDAVVEAKRARELDPLSLFISANVGYRLYFARRYDEAIEALQKTLELDQNSDFTYIFLGYTYAAKGMHREAIAAYQNAIRVGDETSSTQIYLGVSYARAGEREKAQEILKQLQTSKNYVSSGELPILYVALGEREKAFASLEKAYAEHDVQLQFLKVEPGFDPLRSDPRFQDLMRRMNFPP